MTPHFKITNKARKGYVVVWSHREIGAPASSTKFFVTFNNKDEGIARDSIAYSSVADAKERASAWMLQQPIKTAPAGFQFVNANPRTIDGESNDCAVRALSLAFNKPYEEMHKLCASIGRKSGKGMRWMDINAAIAKLTDNPNNKLQTLQRTQTFGTFARDNKQGNYIIIKRGHAVALIDGVFHDAGTVGEPRAIVKAAFKVK